MSSKHTPGPWTIEAVHFFERDGSYYEVWGKDKDGYAVSIGGVESDDLKQRVTDANARLIAAAPDLLEALVAIVEFCDDPDGSEKGESLALGMARMLPAARAAIARARGEGVE